MIRVSLPRMLRVASFRFAAVYLGVFVVSACVLGVAIFLEARSVLRQQLDARIETEASFLIAEFRAEGLSHLLAVVRSRGRGASALDYLVQTGEGGHLAGEIPAQPGLRSGWATIDMPQTSEDDENPERVRALVATLDGGLLLAVGGDLGHLDDLDEAIVTAYLGTTGLVAALGIVGGVLLSRAFLRRVDAISRTAEAIIGGDLTRRIPLRGTGDDLDRLASTLNHMLDRIAALMESLRQVGSDVAHDLRTPLSRLFQRLEDARAHACSIAEYEAAIDAAIGETKGLLDTFSALLRIAQVEGFSAQSGLAEVDLAALVDTVADAYRPDAEASGHSLVTSPNAQPNAPAVVRGDRELLTQALANLIENALHHTPHGSRIVVQVGGSPGSGLALIVEDNGPGVPAAELPRLANRFYRSEQSRTTPGNGLGLSLVAAVAELHGAALILERAEPGLRVTLQFPPAKGAHPVGAAARRSSIRSTSVAAPQEM